MKNIWIVLDDLIQRHSKRIPEQYPAPKNIFQIQVIEEPVIDYDTQAEIERLNVLQAAYIEIDDTIEKELKALETESQDPNLSVKRETAINKRILVLKGKRATNLKSLQAIERNMENQYLKLNGGK